MKQPFLKSSLYFVLLMSLIFTYAPNLKAEGPDLKINSFLLSPIMNDPNQKDATVYLQVGCFANYQNPEIKFFDRVSGQTFYKRMISCAQGNIEFTMCPGTYDGLFTIDHENLITESDESNNTFEQQFTVEGNSSNCTQQSYPHSIPQTIQNDLYINNLYIKSQPLESNKIYMHLISNPAPSAQVKVKISAPSKNLSYTTTIDLVSNVVDIPAPGNPWPSGTYQVIGEIDPNNEIAETNENNNTFNTTLIVVGNEYQYNNKDIDLSYEMLPNTPRQGNNVNFVNLLIKSKVANSPETKSNAPLVLREVRLRFMPRDGVSIFNLKLEYNGAVIGVVPTLTHQPDGNYFYTHVALTQPIQINEPLELKRIKIRGDLKNTGYITFTMSHEKVLPDLSGRPLVFDYPIPQTTLDFPTSEKINVIGPAVTTVIPKNQTQSSSETRIIKDITLYNRLKGNILLKTEDSGKAYYVHPSSNKSYFLGRPSDAFSVMREQGIGISNNDLKKIPIGVDQMSGADQDGDALSDLFEDAIGTDKNKSDSDNDGYTDRVEINTGNNPMGSEKLPINTNFSKDNMGRILLQVEGKGEAWYLNPKDNKRYFLGRPNDAFNIMRNLSVGISNQNFNSLN